MGLFDEIRCEYPLPNRAHQDLVFQTKDLECLMDGYVITKRGRLVRKGRGGRFRKMRRDVMCPIHQELRIYSSVEVAPEQHEWVEYVFRFTDGRATRVRRSRDRHRFAVRKWNPEEWRKQEASPAALPESKPADRLEPALYPRRPTAAEFSSHTPEKLELIDGRIPGDEKLLLLLLTSMGLRRAAGIVGPKSWRSAIAPVRARWTAAGATTRAKGRRKA